MRSLLLLLAALLPLGTAFPLRAQVHSHDHTSPYAGFLDREIKAMDDEEVEGLLSGAGLGMALAAELNGYPGPRHVLEMGPMLGLTPDQETAVRAILEEMDEKAKVLGADVVKLEREMDRSFAEGTVTEQSLEEALDAIGQAKARLRFTHLKAHLQLLPVLTEEQIERYQSARGYGE